MNEKTLGGVIRQLRKSNGWTLRQMSGKVGIPFSTLAKVEQNKLTLTYERLKQLSSRLEMPIAELFSQAEAPMQRGVTGRRSLGASGNPEQTRSLNGDCECLCADLRMKRMMPMIARVRTAADAKPWQYLRDGGETFLFVLEGTIEVLMKSYAPVTLTKGNWIYFDGSMEHAYVAKHCESALLLSVCADENLQ